MVYIGQREYKYLNMIMSHMVADSINELHQMADAIGVQRRWFQNKPQKPHYDICRSMKQKAIALGAKEVNDRELIRVLKMLSQTNKGRI